VPGDRALFDATEQRRDRRAESGVGVAAAAVVDRPDRSAARILIADEVGAYRPTGKMFACSTAASTKHLDRRQGWAAGRAFRGGRGSMRSGVFSGTTPTSVAPCLGGRPAIEVILDGLVDNALSGCRYFTEAGRDWDGDAV
jgi:hypothetical protein